MADFENSLMDEVRNDDLSKYRDSDFGQNVNQLKNPFFPSSDKFFTSNFLNGCFSSRVKMNNKVAADNKNTITNNDIGEKEPSSSNRFIPLQNGIGTNPKPESRQSFDSKTKLKKQKEPPNDESISIFSKRSLSIQPSDVSRHSQVAITCKGEMISYAEMNSKSDVQSIPNSSSVGKISNIEQDLPVFMPCSNNIQNYPDNIDNLDSINTPENKDPSKTFPQLSLYESSEGTGNKSNIYQKDNKARAVSNDCTKTVRRMSLFEQSSCSPKGNNTRPLSLGESLFNDKLNYSGMNCSAITKRQTIETVRKVDKTDQVSPTDKFTLKKSSEKNIQTSQLISDPGVVSVINHVCKNEPNPITDKEEKTLTPRFS